MIGGNITAILQISATTKNEIGESVKSWQDVMALRGWLDLSSGDSKYATFNAKIQESTHVFLMDYMPIPDVFEVDGKVVKVSAESTIMMVNSKPYDVMLIDDPMEMHKQMEIYLKYTGGD